MNKQFEDIKKGLLEAIDYENGKITTRRNVIVITPLKKYTSKKIKEIRNSTGLSQVLFAKAMGVSNKTVEAWESGHNHPDGAATRIISLIENDSNFPFSNKIITIEKNN